MLSAHRTHRHRQGSVYAGYLCQRERLVAVVRCGGYIIYLVWKDANGYITLITVHHGLPHGEVVVSRDDYYDLMSDARQHAA